MKLFKRITISENAETVLSMLLGSILVIFMMWGMAFVFYGLGYN